MVIAHIHLFCVPCELQILSFLSELHSRSNLCPYFPPFDLHHGGDPTLLLWPKTSPFFLVLFSHLCTRSQNVQKLGSKVSL